MEGIKGTRTMRTITITKTIIITKTIKKNNVSENTMEGIKGTQTMRTITTQQSPTHPRYLFIINLIYLLNKNKYKEITTQQSPAHQISVSVSEIFGISIV